MRREARVDRQAVSQRPGAAGGQAAVELALVPVAMMEGAADLRLGGAVHRYSSGVSSASTTTTRTVVRPHLIHVWPWAAAAARRPSSASMSLSLNGANGWVGAGCGARASSATAATSITAVTGAHASTVEDATAAAA